LLIVDLEKTWPVLIEIFYFDFVLIAVLVEDWQVETVAVSLLDSWIISFQLDHLILDPVLIVLGFGYFQDDYDDFFIRNLTPIYLFIFDDGFMQYKLMTLRIGLDN
jgi:hypothetical protein